MDSLDILVVQGTLKSLVQHHSSKPSILHYSPLFMLQLSHPYMKIGKNHSFVYAELFLQSNVSAFKNAARLLIDFLQTSKHLLISWLQLSSAVILEPPKVKSLTDSTVTPSISHEVMGEDAMILVFEC